MGEYWNQFLNWLNQVGSTYNNYMRQREARQDQEYLLKVRLYPADPRVEDRYANSIYDEGSEMHFPMGYKTEEIKLKANRGENSFFNPFYPASIYRYVREPGDTVYTEKTPYKVLGGALIGHNKRSASTKRPRGSEYDYLKDRWIKARKLAK